jgi:hypothetical protein
LGEAENRTESDGKGLFIIRNGQKIAKYEAGKWVPLLPGVVVRNTPDALRLKCRIRPCPALPPKADMCSAFAHVCFGPKADTEVAYFKNTGGQARHRQ